MKLAHIVLGLCFSSACAAFVGCGSSDAGTSATAGAAGSVLNHAGAGNASSSAGFGNVSGAGNNSSGGAGNAPSFAGGGNNSSAGAGNNSSSGGFGNGPSSAGAGGRFGGAAGAGGRSGGAAGNTGTAGASGSNGNTGSLDCTATPAPLTGGTVHTSNNAGGTAAGLSWTIWSNGGTPGSITTYSVPAFSAAFNNSGDFLARIGLQWKDNMTYDQLGTVTAELDYTKSGTGGQYSYIGIYGWSSSDPCVEWYIVDDSYNGMPVNPGNTTNNGTAHIDDGDYILYSRNTSGTGGSKCSAVNGSIPSSWVQYYSVRKTKRDCGQISISEHFKAWDAAGMKLGKMDQAQILVETGPGASGSVDFTTANVTVTAP